MLDCEKVFDQGQREPETEECFNVIVTYSCLRAFVESFPGNLFQPRLKIPLSDSTDSGDRQ